MSDEHPDPDGPTSGAYGQSYGRAPVPGQGAPGFGVTETNRLALSSTITGVIALVPCCWALPVLAVAAVVMGVLGRRQVAASQGRQRGTGLALTGVVLGVVGVLIAVVYWVLVLTGVVDTRFYVRA